MTRTRLPDRRRNAIREIAFGGQSFTVCVGYDDAGRPLEVFADGQKNALSMIASAAGVSGSAITSTWSTILLRVAERGDEDYQGSS